MFFGIGRSSSVTQTAGAADRAYWVGVMRRLADPVLENLAAGTLKARMPVEQAAGSDRRNVSHLEAIGRLLAGMAPWIELEVDDSAEGRLRARYADLARRAIGRAAGPRAAGGPRAFAGAGIPMRRNSRAEKQRRRVLKAVHAKH